MKRVLFYTPTLLSYIDLMSMGGSEKAGDDTKIGTFCSGLKYSMVLAKRHNVDMIISVYDTEFSDNYERERVTTYATDVYTESCEQTGKEKELLEIRKNVTAQNFHSSHTCDYGGGDYPEEIIKTGYSTKMGIDWSLWMLLREVYSNMVDEGGFYIDSDEPEVNESFGTVVKLSFEEGSEFDEIWTNRHLYINEKEPLYVLSNSVDVLENEEGYLRIYKQNILVYKDEKVPSKFAYNIKFGNIDERRILSDLWSVEGSIVEAIRNTNNEDFLRGIISSDFTTKDNEFLSDRTVYGNASDLIHNIAYEVWEEFGEVSSYDWLLNSIKSRKDCKIGGKKIRTVEDSLWSYSKTVTLESTPIKVRVYDDETDITETIENNSVSSFSAQIKQKYNFELDVEVKKAKLKGSKVVADKYCKCLIIDEEFNLEEDFPEFVVQWIDLTQEGNVIKNLSKYICNLLKK